MLTRQGFALAILLAISSASTFGEETPRPTACPPPGTWVRLADESPVASVPPDEVIAEMARRDVVLLGEEHDSADHHRWQLHTLAALHARRPSMVIGFEMFPRRAQPALDRWVAGELTVEQFLQQTNWREVWRFPPELYLPLFQFARIHRVPMVALNVDQKLTREIAAKGWDGVPAEDRVGLSQPAAPSAEYREFLLQVWGDHERPHDANSAAPVAASPAFRNFVDAQLVWDRAMAQGLANRAGGDTSAGRVLAVGIVGSGHLRKGYGVPHQLRALGIDKIGVLLPITAGADCGELTPGLADAVFALAETRAAPRRRPRLGVSLEQGSTGVRLAAVIKDSLAERTGLQEGDVIAAVAGKSLSRMADLIQAVNRQPAGTWLPLRVKRGEQILDIVVKFPGEPEPESTPAQP